MIFRKNFIRFQAKKNKNGLKFRKKAIIEQYTIFNKLLIMESDWFSGF